MSMRRFGAALRCLGCSAYKMDCERYDLGEHETGTDLVLNC